MWPLYLSQAEKHDLQLAEGWKRKTDTTLNVVRIDLLCDADTFHMIMLGRTFLRRRFHISGQGHQRAQAEFVGIAARSNIDAACPSAQRHVLYPSKCPACSSHKAGNRHECAVDHQLGAQSHLYPQRYFGPTLDAGIPALFPVPQYSFDLRKD
jgi:hypothetical protein